MAVKIRMLRKRPVPVLGIEFDVNVELKVNNEVGRELVLEGDAEYVDPELMARLSESSKKDEEVVEVEEREPEIESTAIEPSENAMMPKAKPRKYGKRK